MCSAIEKQEGEGEGGNVCSSIINRSSSVCNFSNFSNFSDFSSFSTIIGDEKLQKLERSCKS